MLEYIQQLPNDYEKSLNTGIMKKTFDRSITEYIFASFKGLEILPNLKILGYDWVPDEDKYNVNDHVVRRNSNKNKIIKNIAETRCGVMYIDVEVRGLNKSGILEIHTIKKPLILPIQDDNGYYLIKGKKCYLIYQMVDKMLYPSFNTVTIKSLMPILVKTFREEFADINGEQYTIPLYTIQIFKNAMNILMIYTHLGVTKTLNFMEVSRFIQVIDKNKPLNQEDNKLYFGCGNKSTCIVVVHKELFEKEPYIQSITGCMIKMLLDNKIQFENIDNIDDWMLIVGGKNTTRRGLYQHMFFNRLLDDVTKMELKINDFDKQDIYHLLRWFIQNYHILWAKDNLSMVNKRMRCNEYICSLITNELSKRINNIVSMGDKATIKEYLNLFKFPEDIFITKLYGSGVLRYSETNSDMDFVSKTKFTKNGPNSLGAKNARRISIRQRSLHPSMLGYIDLADASASDPGQSGSLSPYNPMTSLYFDESLYENELHYRLSKYLDENPLDDDWEELVIKCDNEIQYNDILDKLHEASKDKFIISGTSNNPMEIIFAKDPRDGYIQFDESSLVDRQS